MSWFIIEGSLLTADWQGCEPDADIFEALHTILIDQEREPATRRGDTHEEGSGGDGDGLSAGMAAAVEAADWLRQGVERGQIERDAAAALAASALRKQQAFDYDAAWQYLKALGGVGERMVVLAAIASGGHCKSAQDVEALGAHLTAAAAAAAAAAAPGGPAASTVQPHTQAAAAATAAVVATHTGHARRQRQQQRVYQVSSAHAVLHNAWLGLGASGVGNALAALRCVSYASISLLQTGKSCTINQD
jgi:hypothetical protein